MAQEDPNQALTQGGTGLGEASEVGIQGSVNPTAGLQEHLGNSLKERRVEGLEVVAERSEAASCLGLDHQHHELDQPNRAKHE